MGHRRERQCVGTCPGCPGPGRTQLRTRARSHPAGRKRSRLRPSVQGGRRRLRRSPLLRQSGAGSRPSEPHLPVHNVFAGGKPGHRQTGTARRGRPRPVVARGPALKVLPGTTGTELPGAHQLMWRPWPELFPARPVSVSDPGLWIREGSGGFGAGRGVLDRAAQPRLRPPACRVGMLREEPGG
jgi:hypothetical protein